MSYRILIQIPLTWIRIYSTIIFKFIYISNSLYAVGINSLVCKVSFCPLEDKAELLKCMSALLNLGTKLVITEQRERFLFSKKRSFKKLLMAQGRES